MSHIALDAIRTHATRNDVNRGEKCTYNNNNNVCMFSVNEFSGKHQTVHTSCLIKPPSFISTVQHIVFVCVCVCTVYSGRGGGVAASVAGDTSATATATFLHTKYSQGQ